MNVKFEGTQIVLHLFLFQGKCTQNKSVLKADGGVLIGYRRTITFNDVFADDAWIRSFQLDLRSFYCACLQGFFLVFF